MGDRVLMQVFKLDPPNLKGGFSPVLYGHWAGESAPEICRKIKTRMEGREGDVDYTFARLAQVAMEDSDGNTGWGIWNAEALLQEKDSHGDAGVVLIQVSDSHPMQFLCMGGYLQVGDGGIPSVASEEREEETE